MFLLKISKGQDLKRIAVESLPTFEVVQNLTRSLFPSAEDLTLKYEDDEGDVISIRSDMELQEAYRISLKLEQEPPVLRLYVGSVEIVQEEEVREIEEIDDLPDGYSPFFTFPEEQETHQPEREDIHFLYRVEDQFVQLTNKFSRMFNETEIRDNLVYVKEFCDNQISHGWSNLKDTFVNLRSLVEGNNNPTEEEYFRIQEEIDRVSSEIGKQSFAKQESLSSSSIYAPSEILAEDEPDEQMPEPQPYQSLSFEADIQMAEIVLPSNTALKDLQQLEGMGFLDRSKNVLLLTEHKGDIVAVVEALLSDE